MLVIKNAETDELARRLSRVTGLSITEAVTQALREQLLRFEGRAAAPGRAADIMEIGRRCAALPDIDTRSPDEILGYNEFGGW